MVALAADMVTLQHVHWSVVHISHTTARLAMEGKCHATISLPLTESCCLLPTCTALPGGSKTYSIHVQ